MLTNKNHYKCNEPAYIVALLNFSGLSALVLLFFGTQFSVCAEEREEYEMINFTAGQIGIRENLEGPQRYGLEYRFKSFSGPYGFRLIPAIGAAVAKNNARFLYVDLKHDFYLSNQWLLIPSFGAGIFKDSEEVKLGNKLEFRSGLELAYQFQNNVRVGLAIFHLSNGGISDENPGTESLVFSVCIPLMEN